MGSSSLDACQLRAEAQWLTEWKAGPTKTRWETVPLQAGDPAPNVSVLNSEGGQVTGSSLWRDSPSLVLFWRHFGCGCGLDRLARLRNELPDYEGVNVVIIGQGEPEQAVAYATTYDVPVPIYSDPTRAAYSAFGLLEGLPEQILYDASNDLLMRQWDAGRRFAEERKAQGRSPVDSPWQLQGEFVIDSVGIVRLAYRYQYCEDFPDARIISAVLKRL